MPPLSLRRVSLEVLLIVCRRAESYRSHLDLRWRQYRQARETRWPGPSLRNCLDCFSGAIMFNCLLNPFQRAIELIGLGKQCTWHHLLPVSKHSLVCGQLCCKSEVIKYSSRVREMNAEVSQVQAMAEKGAGLLISQRISGSVADDSCEMSVVPAVLRRTGLPHTRRACFGKRFPAAICIFFLKKKNCC